MSTKSSPDLLSDLAASLPEAAVEAAVEALPETAAAVAAAALNPLNLAGAAPALTAAVAEGLELPAIARKVLDLPDLIESVVPAYPGIAGAIKKKKELFQSEVALDPIEQFGFVPDASAGAAPSFPEGEGQAAIAVLRPADPLGDQMFYLSFERDGLKNVYRLTGWRNRSIVADLLAIAGLTGSLEPVDLEAVPPGEVELVTVSSFDVPRAMEPEVEVACMNLLQGRTPSYHAVLLRQAGYHSPEGLPRLLWEAAGRPPVTGHNDNHFEGTPDLDLTTIMKQGSKRAAVVLTAADADSGEIPAREQRLHWQASRPGAGKVCPVCKDPLVKKSGPGGFYYVCPNSTISPSRGGAAATPEEPAGDDGGNLGGLDGQPLTEV